MSETIAVRFDETGWGKCPFCGVEVHAPTHVCERREVLAATDYTPATTEESLGLEIQHKDARISALTAENERLRLDKERMDWLEKNHRSAPFFVTDPISGPEWQWSTRLFPSLRSAIDAAREGGKQTSND